jgi:hypothetical protein
MVSNTFLLILSFTFIFFLNLRLTLSAKGSNCKIKMATNKMSFAKKDDQLIYDEGVLNTKFGENSLFSPLTSSDNHIEYFYIFEDKIVNPHSTHDKIVFISY